MFLNVCYVLGTKHNLLSVSQIMKHSPQLDVIFSGNKCSIIDRASRTTLAFGLEDHGIYRLVDSGNSLEHAFTTESSTLSNLWHQRYGHLNIQYLAQLARDNLVHGLSNIQIQNHHVCKACQVGNIGHHLKMVNHGRHLEYSSWSMLMYTFL